MTEDSAGLVGLPKGIKQNFYSENINGAVVGIMAGGSIINLNNGENDGRIDTAALMGELTKLKERLLKTRKEEDGANEDYIDITVGEISKARKLLNEGKKPDALRIIASLGKKALNMAQEISCNIVADIIVKKGLGL